MPKITEVIVNAGRTFNHPHESYSNLRPSVTVKADVLDGEDWQAVAKELQAKAESMIEDHKRNMLNSLEELHDLTTKQREVAELESRIVSAQSRLDRIRKETPALQLGLNLPDRDEDDEEMDGRDEDRKWARTERDYR